MPDDNEITLVKVTLTICTLCLAGKGGICHAPGCAFWMIQAPDSPLTQYDTFDLLREEPDG